MTTGYPNTLDNSLAVGDAVAAIETYVGTVGSTDPTSITGQLGQIVPQLPHRPGGLYYVHSATGAATGSNSLTLNTIYAIPFYVPATTTYSAIGVIRTQTVAGGYELLGCYSDGGGVPNNLLFTWGLTNAATDVDQQGFKYIVPQPPSQLTAGWVWLACCPQGAVNTLFCTVGTSTGAPVVLGTSAPSATGMTMGYSGLSSSDITLPLAWGGTYTECAVVPLVYLART